MSIRGYHRFKAALFRDAMGLLEDLGLCCAWVGVLARYRNEELSFWDADAVLRFWFLFPGLGSVFGSKKLSGLPNYKYPQYLSL